jgi:predicted RNA binding protein YcfA (HicA-like mRNA interferase family)
MTSRDVVQILQAHGFVLKSQKGSHQKWVHSETGKVMIVPCHKGVTIKPGTLASIRRGSGLPRTAWETE